MYPAIVDPANHPRYPSRPFFRDRDDLLGEVSPPRRRFNPRCVQQASSDKPGVSKRSAYRGLRYGHTFTTSTQSRQETRGRSFKRPNRVDERRYADLSLSFFAFSGRIMGIPDGQGARHITGNGGEEESKNKKKKRKKNPEIRKRKAKKKEKKVQKRVTREQRRREKRERKRER